MACTMPGFPDKYMPFMEEDKYGGLAANVEKFTIGPVIRWGRNRNIKNKYDKEPEWRRKGRTLDSGYQPRHYAKTGA
jgi:hydrogenase small subunit